MFESFLIFFQNVANFFTALFNFIGGIFSGDTDTTEISDAVDALMNSLSGTTSTDSDSE